MDDTILTLTGASLSNPNAARFAVAVGGALVLGLGGMWFALRTKLGDVGEQQDQTQDRDQEAETNTDTPDIQESDGVEEENVPEAVSQDKGAEVSPYQSSALLEEGIVCRSTGDRLARVEHAIEANDGGEPEVEAKAEAEKDEVEKEEAEKEATEAEEEQFVWVEGG